MPRIIGLILLVLVLISNSLTMLALNTLLGTQMSPINFIHHLAMTWALLVLGRSCFLAITSRHFES